MGSPSDTQCHTRPAGRVRQDDRVTDRDPLLDPVLDPAAMRKQYRAEGLAEQDLAAHPMDQFARWFEDAARAALHGTLYEPNAMVVSTADAQGRPSSRTVLMKQYDTDGFVFFTNYDSRKGRDLAE